MCLRKLSFFPPSFSRSLAPSLPPPCFFMFFFFFWKPFSFNVHKQIQLHNIKVRPQSWIITGDFNSHSPSWGYGQLNSKGEEVENWITENRLILINKPGDPDTFYSRTWRTTSTPNLANATDDIQGIAEREVSLQLGGSDHRPVIISIKGQAQPHRNKLPAS